MLHKMTLRLNEIAQKDIT